MDSAFDDREQSSLCLSASSLEPPNTADSSLLDPSSTADSSQQRETTRSSSRGTRLRTAYEDLDSPQKDAINDYIAQTIADVHEYPVRALVLDAPEMRTTTTLLTRFGEDRVARVVCPQIDPAEAMAMRQHPTAALDAVRIIDQSMSDALEGMRAPAAKRPRGVCDRHFNVLFADYMGTVTGDRSRDLFPLQDMQDFLEHHATRQGTLVFACTFSLRMPLYNGHASADDQIVEDYLKKLWAWCGYRVTGDVTEYKYKRTTKTMPMVFVCATLKFDPALKRQRTAVDFPIAHVKIKGRRTKVKFYAGYPCRVHP